MKRTVEDYDRQLGRLKQEKELWDKRAEIRAVRRSMLPLGKTTTTKRLMAFIFVNCSIVEAYSMIAMWHFEDLSALYALISAVITESISFAVYAAKSYNETKQEELVKLERDKLEAESASRAGEVPDDGTLL